MIELNRPKKLHSLNGSMCRKIVPRLQEWAKSDMANVIVLKGSGPKAFCAGGDVGKLAEWNQEGEEGQKRSSDFFGLEYKLDHLIATYQKPLIAFMDGITMGGGVGLSVHAPFRIATERTLFAMPETTIGFFPDVGGSFFLPRLNGAIGTYLALTSERLKAANVFYAGIASHYIHSSALPSLESRLAELRFKDYETLKERLELIDSTIEEFNTGLPHDEPILLAGELRKAIDRCFSKETVPQILEALEAEKEGSMKEWAEATIDTLHKRSPTSVYVALKQMQLGATWTIDETFIRENAIAQKFMAHNDFVEGVTSILGANKGKKPAFNPATLEDIKASDNIAEQFFRVDGEKLKLLNNGVNSSYFQYPHAKYSLPNEREVESYVKRTPTTKRRIIQHFVEARRGKVGVHEVISEILDRKTEKKGDAIVWLDEIEVEVDEDEVEAADAGAQEVAKEASQEAPEGEEKK